MNSIQLSRRPQRFLLVLCLCLPLVFSGSGCIAALCGAAAGGTGYAYYRGNVAEVYDGDLPMVWEASHNAMFDLGLPVVAENKDALAGTIETANGKQEKVTITIEQQAAKIPTDAPKTKVSVRVGTFGDQDMSRRVQQQIATRVMSAHGGAHVPAVPATGGNQPAAWKPTTGAAPR